MNAGDFKQHILRVSCLKCWEHLFNAGEITYVHISIYISNHDLSTFLKLDLSLLK